MIVLPAVRETTHHWWRAAAAVVAAATAVSTLYLGRRAVRAAFVVALGAVALGAALYAAVVAGTVMPEALIPRLATQARPLIRDVRRIYAAGRRVAALELYVDRRLKDIPLQEVSGMRLSPDEALLIYDRCGHVRLPRQGAPAVQLRQGDYCGWLVLGGGEPAVTMPQAGEL